MLYCSPSGRGSSLHAWPWEDRDHAGLLPGEDQEDVGHRRHQRDSQTAARLDRNSHARESCGAVLPAHKVAFMEEAVQVFFFFPVNKHKIHGRRALIIWLNQ